MVASDLDGTLLHTDGTVSSRARQALQAAAAAGTVVGFVTGRPPRSLNAVADEMLKICAEELEAFGAYGPQEMLRAVAGALAVSVGHSSGVIRVKHLRAVAGFCTAFALALWCWDIGALDHEERHVQLANETILSN